jgi:hypothetical protein
MNKSTAQQKLIAFRNELYQLFPKRSDATMNLLDAISSYAHKCKSVVSLSESQAFKRQYTSITDAIADGMPDAKYDKITKLIYDTFNQDKAESSKPLRFLLDCTCNPRPHAKTCSDRGIVHAPNPAPGNKPIAVGHQYSIIAALPHDKASANKHWVLPVCAKRVDTSSKGNEAGMLQLGDTINTLNLGGQLTISIGDSLYGSQKCRETAVSISNHIHLFRLNGTRNIYNGVEESTSAEIKSKGRQKRYGEKISLKKLRDQLEPDVSTTTTYTSTKGKQYTVNILMWKDKLLRGTHEFKSYEHPINVVCFEVVDADGNPVFKNKCWVAVLGDRRHEISAIDAYNYYRSRYDIEHFFRFCKTKLLIDKYQTPDTEHEEYWWSLCLIAYAQLYFAKCCVAATPKKWEKYLPTFKKNDGMLCSPALAQRGFSKLLDCIDTPAKPCIVRGITSGRALGDVQTKRANQPVIFKTKAAENQAQKSIISGSGKQPNPSEPKIIREIVDFALLYLQKINVSIEKYCDLLCKQPISA